MESDKHKASQEVQRLQAQRMEVSRGANGRYQTRSGATYSKDAPLSPGLLNISCRLGDDVFLGRQVPF